MTAPLPELEPVWVVKAVYAPDAAERRPEFRAEHLGRLAELKAAGTVIEVGAYADLSASLALVRADTEEQALQLLRDDVYFRNGIWTDLQAKPFGRVT